MKENVSVLPAFTTYQLQLLQPQEQFLGFISFLNPSEGFDSPTPSNLINLIAVSDPKRIPHRSLQIWLAETQAQGKYNSDLSFIDGSIIYGADPFPIGLWPSSYQGNQRSPACSVGWKSDYQNVLLCVFRKALVFQWWFINYQSG